MFFKELIEPTGAITMFFLLLTAVFGLGWWKFGIQKFKPKYHLILSAITIGFALIHVFLNVLREVD